MHLVMIGGSDAGISAALRARELSPGAEVTVVVADAFPNFSICGIPYYVSGEVTHWRNLAHRTIADLEAAGMWLRLDTTARRIDVAARKLAITGATAKKSCSPTTGWSSVPARSRCGPGSPAWTAPARSAPTTGCTCCTSMGDTFAVVRTLETAAPASAVIVGAGYIGLEMADALTVRGLAVTQMEQLGEVLPTVDPELGTHVHAELAGSRRRGADTDHRPADHPRRHRATQDGWEVQATTADGAPRDPPRRHGPGRRRGPPRHLLWRPRPGQRWASSARSPSTRRCAPACRMCSPPGTA